jgi:hypothetical protein
MRISLLLALAMSLTPTLRAQTPETQSQDPAPTPSKIPTEPRTEPSDKPAPALIEVAPAEPPRDDYVIVEGIWFDRRKPSRVNLSFFELSDRIALTTDRLEFNSEIGVRVTRGYALGEGQSVEASYFGLHRFEAGRQVSSPVNDLTSFFVSGFGLGTFLFDNFDQATRHDVFLGSELHNGELNYRKEWDWDHGVGCAILVGARYVRLTEDLDFLSIDMPALNTGRYLIATTNNLIGPQFGGECGCTIERAWFGISGRLGLLVNFARQDTQIYNASTLVRTGLGEETHLASLGELGFYFRSRLGEHIQLHAGFQVLAMGGLALAPDQLDFFSGIDSQQGIHVNGWTMYYGPSAGLLIRW